MARAGRAPRIVALGDAAILADFSDTLDLEVNAQIQQLAEAIRRRRLPWIRDVVPAIATLALYVDPAHDAEPLAAVTALIGDCLGHKLPPLDELGRTVTVPVCYDPELAPDLLEVAARTGLTPQGVARLHVAGEHRVLMVGFAPGQPYIGGVDARLALPRRATPRARVPAGSVATANAQTVVYPYALPGGWHVIGRTPLRGFDVRRDTPSLFAPGDRVRFVAISRGRYDELDAEAAAGPRA